MSVRKGTGGPLYVALAIWQLYCTELLDGLAGRRVLIVRYETFIADPDRNTRLLLDWLAESLPLAGADAGRAQGFVSPGMRHHHTGPADQANEQELTAAQLALYRWLAGLPEGWAQLAAPAELPSRTAPWSPRRRRSVRHRRTRTDMSRREVPWTRNEVHLL